MRNIVFHQRAFYEYNEWATENRKLFSRLHKLIVETAREPFVGTGKPEPLKNELQGYWSRRINEEHRLVYKATDDQLIIVSCKYHY